MSECGVCLWFDGDRAEAMVEQMRRAAKEHQCSECRRPIARAERYQFVKLLDDGEWKSYRTCLVCAEIRKAFSCEGEMFGGTFWSELRDYGFPDMANGCLQKLTTTAAKRELARRYREWNQRRLSE